ncbi:AAA family ATPase [Methylobacterium sp. E-016]|uniref:AAA family ATPase n=1 Tax=Methylobacterium sp. E-016 TaxID=2836556 RepID=UPI001FBBF28D|nr:AAA family ATPase [Methylobacterium sp. E-016]MCJ2074439.1 AAA family ATPase [Methylobacterium sp. E-016]
MGLDARREIPYLLTPLLDLPMTGPAFRAVQRAINAPTLRRLRAVEAALRADQPADVGHRAREVADLLPFHQSALGCDDASARCAADALDAAMMRVQAGDWGHAFLSFRVACLWASDAQMDATNMPYVGGPLRARLHAFDQKASAWLGAFQVFAAAEAMVADEDAILRGGAGQHVDGDPVPLDDILAMAHATEILRRGADKRAAVAQAVRTLVVLPSLAHLPKPSVSTQDRGDSPRAAFEPIAGKALPLRTAPDPHQFVEEASARAPWLRPVFETIAQDLVGAPYAWIRPTLFVGGAGAGKTAAAVAVARGLGLPFRVYGVTSTADGTFAGTNRQWSSGRPSIPAQTVRQEEIANPAIIVDELEKGTPDRRNGRLDEALLPFLERETARRIFDPYLECALDLSAVPYLATANDLQGVPGPLRDRFRIVRIPMPRREDLPVVAANLIADLRAERGTDAAWLPDLDGDELALLRRHWKGGSLRPLRRLVETLLAGRDRLAPRH